MFSKYGCRNNARQPVDVESCICFENGYEAGKEKVYFELEHWQPVDHPASCGCQPCVAARSIVHKVLCPVAWG